MVGAATCIDIVSDMTTHEMTKPNREVTNQGSTHTCVHTHTDIIINSYKSINHT